MESIKLNMTCLDFHFDILCTPEDIFTCIARICKFVMKAANMDALRIFAFVSYGLQNETYVLISVQREVVFAVWLQTLYNSIRCLRSTRWRYRYP